MGIIVRVHSHSDGAVARPDYVNKNSITLYNLVNGNIDWENLKAALQNAANGFVKLDGDAKVPVAQLPTTIPSGVIVMWSGTLATIPSGWSLCDGAGGTPDLRDKFIYGWTDGVDPGDEGGALIHTHTYSDVPSHSHAKGTLANDSPGEHRHYVNMYESNAGTWEIIKLRGQSGTAESKLTSLSGDHTHTISGSTALTGVASPETDAGSTLPPYFKLAFIIKD